HKIAREWQRRARVGASPRDSRRARLRPSEGPGGQDYRARSFSLGARIRVDWYRDAFAAREA
ncbi:MAG: hypothetical protein ACHQ50_02015, partial [Fimbriimonadales bacterium]